MRTKRGPLDQRGKKKEKRRGVRARARAHRRAKCILPRRIRSDGTNEIQFYSTMALTPGAHKARDNEIIIRRTSAESNPIYSARPRAPNRKRKSCPAASQ